MYRNCQKIQNCVGIVWGIVRIFTDLGNNSDNSEFSDSLACARAKPQNSVKPKHNGGRQQGAHGGAKQKKGGADS